MTTDKTAAIRATFKARGWNSRQVSVRTPHYGSISVCVRDLRVNLAEVKAVANAQEEIRRDDFGEILCGGNTFVSISVDEACLAPLVAKLLPKLGELEEDKGGMEIIPGYVVFRQKWDWNIFTHDPADGSGSFLCRCCSPEGVANVLAQLQTWGTWAR